MAGVKQSMIITITVLNGICSVQFRTTELIPLSLSLDLLSAFSDWACPLSDFVDFLSLSLSSFFLPSVLACFFSSGGGVFSSFQRGKAWRRSFQISTVLPHLQRKDNDNNYNCKLVLCSLQYLQNKTFTSEG